VLMRFALRQYYASPLYVPASAAPPEMDGSAFPVSGPVAHRSGIAPPQS